MNIPERVLFSSLRKKIPYKNQWFSAEMYVHGLYTWENKNEMLYDTASFSVFGFGKYLVISNLCLENVSFVSSMRKCISYFKSLEINDSDQFY